MGSKEEHNLGHARQKNGKQGVEGYARHAMLIVAAQLILAKVEQEQVKRASKKDVKEEPVLEQSTLDVFAHDAVLQAMAEIAETYIREMGRYSKDQAELAGRTQSNLNDVLGSISRASLVTQTSTRELALYSMYEQIDFPRKLAPFVPEAQTLKRPREATISVPGDDVSLNGQGPSPVKKGDGLHIESWMPPLPPAYTYIATPAQVKLSGTERNEQLVGKQRRQAEKELVRLTRQAAGRRKPNILGDNPFLRPPRAVSVIGRPNEPEETAGKDRDLLEADDAATTVVNRAQDGDHGEPEHDLKKLRVERILASSGTVGD